jgi:excinuclease ABC subunit A
MASETGRRDDIIRIKGARQNNLKGFDLDLPVGRLIVITGLSGSGKSSLAFDTLYAEGQRRYIETFSPYARQFFDRMDKPRVDAIEGIPPAIALEQRNSVRTTRSTVGTMTEVCDHLKVLWPHLARLHCRQCSQPVTQETPRDIWDKLLAAGAADQEALVTFDLALSAKLSLKDQLALVTKQGFQRLLVDGAIQRVEEADALPALQNSASLTVVQDRVRLASNRRPRFMEACEQAYHFGHGKLSVRLATATAAAPKAAPAASGEARSESWAAPRRFSRHLHCATCDLEYKDPSPALFSFNHPIGACPACKGFGRIIAIDYDRAIPDRSKTLAEGAVRPWQTGMSAECQSDLVKAAKSEGIPMDVPFRDLPASAQRWVIDGDPDYSEENSWPKAWYGVKGYFRWLESKAYKMHVRVLLSRYRAYRTCPTCNGQRLQPDALLWRLITPAPESSLTLADFYALPARTALDVIERLAATRTTAARNDPLQLALNEVQGRLRFLDNVGVGYLTLDRPTRTLSGGETQRVNLTTCLGSRLVNTLFVLDEPSVGLHARDTDRLVGILAHLRDLGNTVVVVEHEAAVMRAADLIVDLGPGHGDAGGQVVVRAPYAEVLDHPTSLTGAYLSGRRRIEIPQRRPVHGESPTPPPFPSRARAQARAVAAAPGAGQISDAIQPYRTAEAAPNPGPVPSLRLRGISRNNLVGVDAEIPLGRLVCLTGVSGSGKTTLAGELLRLLGEQLSSGTGPGSLEVRQDEKDDDRDSEEGGVGEIVNRGEATLEGAENLGAVLLVDQSPIGRTPRSNPAVYTGAFDHLRDLFAQTEAARDRGLNASAFSFNSAQGQCEQCRGAGFEKIEMQFLSDVFIRCPACEGRRYRPHLLDVRLAPATSVPSRWPEGVSIAEALELTIDDACEFLAAFDTPPARRAATRLALAREVGLGYLRLGQPINTLSGGESQRLKLAGHLAESVALGGRAASENTGAHLRSGDVPSPTPKPTLFVFDEPTTGLHFEDVRILVLAFQRLVDAGHSVLIIEHNLEVLKCADWLIDLGPEAGADGGRIVVAGTPEKVAGCPASHTGRALRDCLNPIRR